MEIKEISKNIWQIEKSGDMNVPVIVYASKELMKQIKNDKSLEQAINVSKLPGIIKHSIAMPDMHQGYGFPIGGVAAFDLEDGVISPGGVGFDINCGVRVLATNILKKDFMAKRKEILHEINETIPTGVGFGHKERLSDEELNKYLVGGAEYAVKAGNGVKEDLLHCEEGGKMDSANPDLLSQRAKARGKPQLGTLGAGNHFIEIQTVEEIYNEDFAKKNNLDKDTICIMIHCGSRGLGHQVASDYIQKMEKQIDISKIPDRQLVYAKFNSEIGQEYLQAMNCAINFAFANRQIIMNNIRKILNNHFPDNKNNLIYDVCHNIAKVENHKIDGEYKDVCVHRKGATRAFLGEPVIIPGSMGTASYILLGGENSEESSFSSTAHGAGRIMGRKKASEIIKIEDVKAELEEKDIIIENKSNKGIIEEASSVYKDIEEVIQISDDLSLAKKAVKLKPIAVIKG